MSGLAFFFFHFVKVIWFLHGGCRQIKVKTRKQKNKSLFLISVGIKREVVKASVGVKCSIKQKNSRWWGAKGQKYSRLFGGNKVIKTAGLKQICNLSYLWVLSASTPVITESPFYSSHSCLTSYSLFLCSFNCCLGALSPQFFLCTCRHLFCWNW